MKKIILLSIFLFFAFADKNSFAQVIPQQAINESLSQVKNSFLPAIDAIESTKSDSTGVYLFMKQIPGKIQSVNQRLSQSFTTSMTDTIIVGLVPNDTLYITGTFFNNGPILVFNDGVLIFENANAVILGDIFVFQNGKLFADSSVINSPQQYFYQRSLLIANNGYVNIANTTLDFGGLSHNLAVVDSGEIILTNITNIGFTTAGAYGNASITIDGSNQAGEFIMTDSSQLSFTDANTILLWHHIPDGGMVDVSFQPGASVASYIFNDAQPNVSGIGYNVSVSNCTDIMWALMPENGSDVTVTGSSLRAIGLWFVGSDTVAVSGLVNNSNYNAFTAPVTDRVLQLNSTSVQTWSLYLFNQTVMNVTGCIVGEVGSMGTSFITAQGIFCDGSGGYYWATDTSFSIAINTTISGYIRSQGYGIVLLGYGTATSGASATGNSVMVVTQSILPQDPIAYEHGVAWRVHINPPQNLFVDTIIDISGSAFIDQGPLGAPMDFGYYTMEYRAASSQQWLQVTSANTNEVHNSLLSQWDTQGLTPGNYQLRLNTWNNSADSIDAVIQVTLLPSVLLVTDFNNEQLQLVSYYENNSETIFVNCSPSQNEINYIRIADISGKIIYESEYSFLTSKNTELQIPFSKKPSGIYFVSLLSGSDSKTVKISVIK